MDECRACLQATSPAHRHVLFERGSNGSATFHRYNMLTSIEIKHAFDNGRNNYVCSQCERKLIDFEQFRNLCIESDRKIRRTNRAAGESFVDIVVKPEPTLSPVDEDDGGTSEDDDGDNDNDDDANKGTRNGRRRAHRKHSDDDDDDDEDGSSIKSEHPSDDDDDHKTTSTATSRTPSSRPNANNRTPQQKFECDICGQKFNKKHRIEAHLRTHLDLKPFCCARCPSTFRNFSTLRLHEKSKHPDPATVAAAARRADGGGGGPAEKRRFPCKIEGCVKHYADAKSLSTHVKRFHLGEKPVLRLVCETCGAAFHSGWALNEHMYKHRDPSTFPYVCDMCPKRFSNKHTFQLHVMRHKNIRNFSCPLCETRTVTKAELDVHLQYHNKDPTFVCDLCPKKFTTKDGLHRHKVRVHEGLKPYICTHCGLAFGKKQTMVDHMMRHTGEKPFACTICDRRFIKAYALKAHIKVHYKHAGSSSEAQNATTQSEQHSPI